MVGDYVMKLLNRVLFILHRGIIIIHISIMDLVNYPIKERVRNDKLIYINVIGQFR